MTSRSVAVDGFDPEVDVDWSAPWRHDLYAMPPERVSLYGSRIWVRMSEDERRDRALHEAVAVLSFGAYLITVLVATQLRRVSEGGLNTAPARTALVEIGGSTRAAVLFGRVVGASGLPPYPLPRGTLGAVKFLAFVPLGASSFGASLLVENTLTATFDGVARDERVEPHVRQALRLFASESEQRTAFAREQVLNSMERGNAVSRAYHRTLLAVVADALLRMPATGRVRPTVGPGPGRWRTRRAASRGERAARARVARQSAEFFASAGLMDCGVARRLWALTGTTTRFTTAR
ncbi:hypothetical protein GCM10007304_06570 [Rhodococcoides trifolii]|uniref:Uncharacterized protein n=1 Tax=Rhodococcoides trifolii TaxID=908250 RepID=A0A917FQW1_9NOCA|nr:diiron oxygenase [Rhodococcus trifolii]GGF95410.1 hypothetical protein GCM10007304_06570 [Rhodococcus trifolii]